jgi:20S proteasome subunit beta 7
VYGPYDSSYVQQSLPKTHTQSPAVTGTSVLGVKFRDGVVIAADNLGMEMLLILSTWLYGTDV